MTLEEKCAIEQRLADLTVKGAGRLTPESVVEDARNPKSPLHAKIFSETDREAAHAYRLDKARQLIRSVRVNVTIERRAVSVVGYVHDPSGTDAGYVPTVSLVNERDRARVTIEREFARIEACLLRSCEIADALGLKVELEQMLAGVRLFVDSAIKEAA